MLLAEINHQPQRLTDLSKVLKASAQECSRHLSRLSDSGYIKKESDGSFETTPLGKALVRVLPSIQFLLQHRNYFLSHDLSRLPTSYVERIGELTQGKLVGHFNIVLDHIKKVIIEGNEFVSLIADQPVVPTATMGGAFRSRSIPVKLIINEGYDMKMLAAAKSVLPEKFETATLNQVHVAMAINEKLAGVCFPGPDGKLDFGVGFVGSDSAFRGWCTEMPKNYWTESGGGKRL